jgi:hypothetical protein
MFNINIIVKYDLIIEKNLDKLTSLQKVRIKADPKYLHKEGRPENCPTYEGYILEEGLTKVKILILPPDLSIEDIPTDLIEYIADEEKSNAFEDLKAYIIQHLGLKEDNPLVSQIAGSTCITDIETFLKQTGIDDQTLAELYSSFILT